MKHLAFISFVVLCFANVSHAEYYQQNYYQQQYVPAQPAERKLSEEKAKARDGYSHLFTSTDTKDTSVYARTEDGSLRAMKFGGPFGFAVSDDRGFFTVQSLLELKRAYAGWADGANPPNAATTKDIRAAIEKLPAIVSELEPASQEFAKLYRKASGEVFTRAKDGSFVAVTLGEVGKIEIAGGADKVSADLLMQARRYFARPLEGYSDLRTTDTGGVFGVKADGSLVAIAIEKNATASGATELPDSVVESYVRFQRARLEGGQIDDVEKATVSAFLDTEVAQRGDLKPMDGFEGLFVSPKKVVYGALSDGSRRPIQSDISTVLKITDAPKGATVPEQTLNSYADWLVGMRDSGRLTPGQLRAAGKVFVHHALAHGEVTGKYEQPLLYRAHLPDGLHYYFAMRSGNLAEQGSLFPVQVRIAGEDGEFVRRGKTIKLVKGYFHLEVPSVGHYRIHEFKPLTLENAPKGIAKNDVEEILSGHTKEELVAIQYINNIRAKHRLHPVRPAADMRPAAHQNSVLQTQRGLGHHAGNGYPEIAHHGPGDPYTCVYGGGGTTGWEQSGGHLGTMIGGYTQVGLARVGNSWTAVFR